MNEVKMKNLESWDRKLRKSSECLTLQGLHLTSANLLNTTLSVRCIVQEYEGR